MSDLDPVARRGYLLLADISGYTAFLTGTELEHAQAIIRELTKLIRERLIPPMRFVKLEGDAVFCYAEGETFANGERFIELVEACYFDFANRLLDMERGTTCRCDACAAIPSLDLKFVAHYGGFMIESEDGREDLAGPDVILAHRLLKNSIGEGGGPGAYAFFTGACQRRLPSSFELPQHRETYDSFGEVAGGVYDLKPALRWQPFQTDVENQPNDGGRMGVGAASHCAHGAAGDALREYLDWRPFRYFTSRFTPLPNGPPLMPRSVETMEFVPLDDGGTSIHWRIKLEDRAEEAVRHFEAVAAFLETNAPELWGEALRRVLEEDGVVPGSGDASV